MTLDDDSLMTGRQPAFCALAECGAAKACQRLAVRASRPVDREAHASTLSDYERLYPGGLVAPQFAGQFASREDLVYNGAEPAAAFPPRH